MGWSEVIIVDGHQVFVCSRGGRPPKTWKCECGKNTPNAERVCKWCGRYRDGCPQCDSDLVPAPNPTCLWSFPPVFQRGVKRRHVCNGNKSITGRSCGYWTEA